MTLKRFLAILRMYQIVQPWNALRQNTIKNLQREIAAYEI